MVEGNESVRLRRIREAEAARREENAKSATRLFITSYQKTGTHQIMPMFAPHIANITDASRTQFLNMPDCYGMPKTPSLEAAEITCGRLKAFVGAAFGHIAYRGDFAEAVQHRNTRVLFNVRDPRDVIVAEYERIKFCYKIGKDVHGWLNHRSKWGGELHWLSEGPDPFMELIEIAAARWPMWLGWLDHDFVMKVKFEELRLETHETIGKIRAFITPYLAPDFELMGKKVRPRPQNPTFRKGAVGEWKNYFEPRHIEAAERLMGDIFERLDYKL